MMRSHPGLLIWDRMVRVLHALLIVFVPVAYLSPAGRSVIHETAGYVTLVLVAIRLLWGWVGSPHARFSNFVTGPGALLRYLRDTLAAREPRHLGHNPAGAAMIVLLLTLIGAIGVSGILLTQQAWRDDRNLQYWHGTLSDLLIGAVAVHIIGAIYTSLRHRENLVLSMITGRKRP